MIFSARVETIVSDYRQPPLPIFQTLTLQQEAPDSAVITSSDNSLGSEDRRFHDWYRFVLSYPPHLVRDYLRNFDLQAGDTVLDPFCGTGTTLVEAKLNGLKSVGIEANPFPRFASSVKVDWAIQPEMLTAVADEIADKTYHTLNAQGIDDNNLFSSPNANLRTLDPKVERALIKNSISPLPLHKSLVLLEVLNQFQHSPAHQYGLLALGNALVTSIGNLRFGPEVGVGKIKRDIPVVAAWKHEVQKMVADLGSVQGNAFPTAEVHLGDARNFAPLVAPHSVDAVITSPPYPNEKDYTRTTRLESVILGFFSDMTHLRIQKKRLLRSNTRGVYKVDDDDKWIRDNQRIQQLAEKIENRRIALGKTSGFEKLYSRVTRLYFGGMARHFFEMSKVLKPGAKLAYVVGDQASY
ncbi:MAG: hypothetical protein KC425_16505, partial [Anaerolineales bacterium]|nr:hypothetical protein [Anaerolineales bacterium]